ncbi:hypothetical protein PCASD_16030 [Puccinia coronata f. sp. avenae]|uniref:Uncharacterized protein n=1 Tax=Puccinia coronata f. sp. avenae TaxID=200324 RepID=A0A2N5TZW0_9BASI|nr:hypothetical protein PCASD_16030 [Puccinia coronata f. sp. avenae]
MESENRLLLEEIAIGIDTMAQDNDLPGNNVEAKENEGLDQGTDGRSWMEYEIERIRHDLSLDDPAEELDEMVENNQDWFPFKSQIVREDREIK